MLWIPIGDYWLVRHREVSTATRSFRIPRSSPGRCFVGSGGARGGDRGGRGGRDVLNRKRDFLILIRLRYELGSLVQIGERLSCLTDTRNWA